MPARWWRIGGPILGVLVLGIGAVIWMNHAKRAGEPVHAGKSLNEWLYGYYRVRTVEEVEPHYWALKALRQHSLPILAEMTVENARPSRWQQILAKVTKEVGFPDTGVSAERLHDLSLFALQTFDPSAHELLPAAENLFRSPLLGGNRVHAVSVLRYATKDAEACVPFLSRGYDDAAETGEAASEVARELFKGTVPSQELLEPLMRHLHRGARDYGSLDDSYAFLAEFGFAASNAAPWIRVRFEQETNTWYRGSLAGLLVRIDPTATRELELITDWVVGSDEELRSAGISSLLLAGPAAVGAAERIWNALDASPERQRLEDVLVSMFQSRPGSTNDPAPRHPLVERLLKRFEQHFEDPKRTVQLNDRLNPAWRALRLNPQHARAWEVFRGVLMQDVDNDPQRGRVLASSAALWYLMQIPIDAQEKIRLLRETLAYYDGISGMQANLREEATRLLIRLNPDERPSNFEELVELYLE